MAASTPRSWAITALTKMVVPAIILPIHQANCLLRLIRTRWFVNFYWVFKIVEFGDVQRVVIIEVYCIGIDNVITFHFFNHNFYVRPIFFKPKRNREKWVKFLVPNPGRKISLVISDQYSGVIHGDFLFKASPLDFYHKPE